jgi:hypothetical protein
VWFSREESRKCTNRWDYSSQQTPPRDADGVWGGSANPATLPAGWSRSGTTYTNAQGVVVYTGGQYTSGDYILYEDSGSHACHKLNDPANRLSWNYCVNQTIEDSKLLEGQVNPTYKSACA